MASQLHKDTGLDGFAKQQDTHGLELLASKEEQDPLL